MGLSKWFRGQDQAKEQQQQARYSFRPSEETRAIMREVIHGPLEVSDFMKQNPEVKFSVTIWCMLQDRRHNAKAQKKLDEGDTSDLPIPECSNLPYGAGL